MRVYELSQELSLTNRELINILKGLGIEVKSHFSQIDEEVRKIIKELLEEEKRKVEEEKKKEELRKAEEKKKEEEQKLEQRERKKEKEKEREREREPQEQVIELPSTIPIRELSSKFNTSIPSLLKSLINIGVIVNINQSVNYEIVEKIAPLYGYKVKLKEEEIKATKDVVEEEKDLTTRYPIVTVMGHVDHGKTKLLDAIRKTNVAEKEAGGITQHIGASVVRYNNKKIVFLDTPGHEAFTQMRARGAKVTDIVVLVVAADDGVMPQTVEAIDHAKAAKVPIIVAINKIDKENANIDRVKRQLSDYGLIPEDWGGDTICVPISAKYNQNLDDLLEMISLQSEMLELKASLTATPRGNVIEARVDKGKGPIATVILQHGRLRIGDAIVVGTACGKIRAMIDDKGKRVKEAGPSEPVEIFGLDTIPHAGDTITKVENELIAREIAKRKKEEKEEKRRTVSLENLYSRIQEEKLKELNIIIKADVYGSIEALQRSIERLNEENIKPQVIHAQVGSITETDVLLAQASNAIIIGFNSKPTEAAKKIADREGIDIRCYSVIYYVIEDIKAAIAGLLEPKYVEEIIGKAEVRAIFKTPKFGKVAGCYIKEGVIRRDASVRIIKDEIVIHEGKIGSLKRFKEDVKEVKEGFECGIGIEDFTDYTIGDILEVYELKEVKR